MNYQDSTKETIIADGGGTAVARAREEMAYVGAKIKDRYLIEKQLDSGGFGAVYLAHDQELLGKPVAHEPAHDLGSSTGRERDHQLDRPRRIVLG